MPLTQNLETENTEHPSNRIAPPRSSLASKLAAVMGELTRIPKTGLNSHFNYAFVEEHMLVEHVRDKLSARNIILLPNVVAHQRDGPLGSKGDQWLSTVTVEFTWIDGDSGERLTTRMAGQGMDNQDKGFYKAYTGALKYLLMKTFLLPTGDDSEYDDRGQPAAPHPKSAPSSAVATGADAKPSTSTGPRASSTSRTAPSSAPPRSAAPAPSTSHATGGTGKMCEHELPGGPCNKPIDDRVAEYSKKFYGKQLCLTHQQVNRKIM